MLAHLVPILFARPLAVGVTAILTSSVGSTAGEDCTAAGYADYLCLCVPGGSNDERKNGVNRIGAATAVGSATRNTSGSPTPTDATYTGTDGNNTASWAIGSASIWTITALATDKVSITIPLPDTASHTVKFACGTWNNSGTCTATARASLSGGGAGPTADVITSVGVQTYKQITYTVRANSGGQNLVLTIEGTSTTTAASDVWLLLNRITYL